MLNLKKHYLLNSRRDLISKSNRYKNINEVSFIKSVSLEFLNIKHKSACIVGLCFIFLFLGLRGKYGKRSGSGLKKKLFCLLELNDEKNILAFLEKYIFIELYNRVGNEKLFKNKNLSNVGTFSFIIDDLYKLLELDENMYRFRNLPGLRVTLVFNENSKKNNLVLLKSLGFSFKN